MSNALRKNAQHVEFGIHGIHKDFKFQHQVCCMCPKNNQNENVFLIWVLCHRIHFIYWISKSRVQHICINFERQPTILSTPNVHWNFTFSLECILFVFSFTLVSWWRKHLWNVFYAFDTLKHIDWQTNIAVIPIIFLPPKTFGSSKQSNIWAYVLDFAKDFVFLVVFVVWLDFAHTQMCKK